MKRLLIAVVALLAFVGCQEEHKVASEILTEQGEVLAVAYMPANHGSSLDMGVTTGGDLAFTPTSVSLPEKYAVVFKCEHGSFAVEGDKNSKAYTLFTRLKQGDHVVIEYREIYLVVSEDGKELYRTLYDLDFVDVRPIPSS